MWASTNRRVPSAKSTGVVSRLRHQRMVHSLDIIPTPLAPRLPRPNAQPIEPILAPKACQATVLECLMVGFHKTLQHRMHRCGVKATAPTKGSGTSTSHQCLWRQAGSEPRTEQLTPILVATACEPRRRHCWPSPVVRASKTPKTSQRQRHRCDDEATAPTGVACGTEAAVAPRPNEQPIESTLRQSVCNRSMKTRAISGGKQWAIKPETPQRQRHGCEVRLRHQMTSVGP